MLIMLISCVLFVPPRSWSATLCLLEHVKSHQDDATDVVALPFAVQLNMWCDAMATAQLDRQSTNPLEASLLSNPLPTRHLPVELRYRDHVILSHYVSRLRDAILGRHWHRAYVQAKFHWSANIMAAIAWVAFEKCDQRPALSHPVTRCKLPRYSWLN
jgi:hypothetical protein